MDSGQKVLEGVNKGDRSVDAIIIANKLINRAGINLISDPKGARVRLEKAERLLDAVLGANYRMIRNEPGNYDPANPFADQFARIYAYYDYLNTNKV